MTGDAERRMFVYHVTIRLMGLVLVAVMLASCGGATPKTEHARVLMSGHNGWNMRVTPTFSHSTNHWRAGVEVWPPDRNYQIHPGIIVHFTETAWDQRVVVQAAFDAARRYIDASRAQHR